MFLFGAQNTQGANTTFPDYQEYYVHVHTVIGLQYSHYWLINWLIARYDPWIKVALLMENYYCQL